MDDNPALREAAQVVDTAAAEDRADVVAAFYKRLRNHKVPELAAREFTCLEFYAHDVEVEWDDD